MYNSETYFIDYVELQMYKIFKYKTNFKNKVFLKNYCQKELMEINLLLKKKNPIYYYYINYQLNFPLRIEQYNIGGS